LKGAHIAIFSENSCRYVLADITVSSGVGVVTPIDVNAPVNLVVTLLGKCDADAVLCGAGYIDRILEAQKECPRVKTLITLDRKVEGYPFYDELVEKGRSLKEQSVYRGLVSEPDAPAKILFTSGTTGANKPVLLSNANLAANMMNCIDVIRAKGDNTSMSVLPMHHATEINTHIMARIGCGRLTYINDNMRNMMVNIKIFKPDVITIVPMIASAFYKTIWAQAKKAGKDEKLRKGIKLCNLLRKFGIDKTHDLFKDVYAPFGGNLKLIVCGGSMLNPVVIKGMNDLGIQIHNGYGITECGPLISMNADTLDEHLSVGPACPGLEVKIENPDEDGVGELCVRGKSVSHGYYKDPAATAAVFSEDGFFNTGDSARIDSKGRIILVGRKKNTIVLQSGKNISPEEVENVIETHLDYADDIAVYLAALPLAGGTSRDILCAGLYIKDQEIRRDTARIRADIEAVNALLPEYKNIEYIELVDEEYEKTSTRKIRRTQLPTVCSGKGIHLI
jgi:long-chain acyl-CoA synthetase